MSGMPQIPEGFVAVPRTYITMAPEALVELVANAVQKGMDMAADGPELTDEGLDRVVADVTGGFFLGSDADPSDDLS